MKRIQKVLAHLCAAAISIAAVPLPEAAFLRSAAAQTGITRAEWIHELVTVFDMSVPDETELETCCTDTGSSTYAHDIDLAAYYGVFDTEGDTFDPDGFVTREFAAHTANYCMGYLDNGTEVTFADSDAICYAYDAAVAVQHGWFTVSAGNFNPDALMTQAEETRILQEAQSLSGELAIDEEAEQTVQLKNSVIRLDDSVDAAYFAGYVVIYGTAPALKAGNLFTVSLGGADHLYKAKTVTKDKDGNMLVDVAEADLREAVTGLNIQGYGDVDYSQAMFYATDAAPGTGNLIKYKPGISAVNSVQSQVVQSIDVTTDEHNLPAVTFSEEIDFGGASISVEGSIKNIKPEYKLDYDGTSVNSFYLNVDADAELSCTMSGKLESTGSREISLAKIPVWCGGPMSANVVVTLSVSVTGEVSMQYTWDCSGGVSYTKAGGWRVTRNFQKKGFSITASGSEKIAAKLKLNAEVFGCEVGCSYITGGEKGTFKSTPRGAFFCEDLKVYAFAEFGAKLNLFDLISFSQSVEFINADNSPLRYHKHWEDGVEVSKCTYSDQEDETETGTGSTSGTGKRKAYYAPYSEYGLEFDDVISAVNATDTSTARGFQFWDEDRTLTDHVTVNGNLYIECNVDLNGKILTVNGNVYQRSGALEINNGTLNISGSYYMQNTSVNSVGETEYDYCEAVLWMTHTHDKVNIQGDFITHLLAAYNCQLSEGTLSVAGNVWCDQGLATMGADDNFTLVLNGTGDQSVYMGDDSARFHSGLEVTDPDKRTIVCSGNLYIHKLLSDMHIRADGLEICELDVNRQNVTIDGDVTVTAGTNVGSGYSVDLNGGTLTVNGNLTHDSGEVCINNGTLTVNGDYRMEDTTVNNVGETEYNICQARLEMTHPHDKVNINGSFTTHNLSGTGNCDLSNGVMTVTGDIWTDGLYNECSDDMTLVLAGTSDQSIITSGEGFHTVLPCVEVTDPQNRSILWSGNLGIHKLLSDMTVTAQDLTICELDLNGHILTVNGDTVAAPGLTYYDKQIDLNAGTLVVNGDLTHRSGEIYCDNGALYVNGSYYAQDESVNNVGEIEYNQCNAWINMTHAHDRVQVSGDFITHNLIGGYFALENGVLAVGGNIWSDGGLNFSETGTHRTILNGSKKQTVTLDEQDSFDVLVLTRPRSNYTFTPSPCWHTLITVEEGTGDVNADGALTVADLVLLQEWIARVPGVRLPCWQTADVYDDDRLDVVDLTMLRQKLLSA